MIYFLKRQDVAAGSRVMLLAKTLRRKSRIHRCAFWLVLGLGPLSGCGGGAEIIAAIAVVTPLGGIWADDPNAPTETLQFIKVPVETEVLESVYDLEATLQTASGICGGKGSLEGTLDNGDLVLRQAGAPKTTKCLEGKFTDMVTLELMSDTKPVVYLNDRVDVNLDIGLWVNEGSGQLKLKFDKLQSGEQFIRNNDTEGILVCDVSTGPGGAQYEGEISGFNTTTRAKPAISGLKLLGSPPNASPEFTQVVFVDGATLSLVNSAGQPVTLHRTNTAATCP
jgi:hypothetical protein